MSTRVNRSIICSCSVCGRPPLSNQNSSLNWRMSTTKVSPSQRPTAVAIEERVVVVALKLADVLAAVGVDDAAVAVAAAQQDEHALEVGLLDELESVDLLELARAAGRLTGQEHRIALQERALPQLIEASAHGCIGATRGASATLFSSP